MSLLAEGEKKAVVAPARTVDQRMAALRVANQIRIDRAEIKRKITAGTISVQDLILIPPRCIEGMYVGDLMRAIPKFGHVKVARALNQLRISSRKKVAGLSPRQRDEVFAWLEGSA